MAGALGGIASRQLLSKIPEYLSSAKQPYSKIRKPEELFNLAPNGIQSPINFHLHRLFSFVLVYQLKVITPTYAK